jgi:hypothetical protein
MIKIGKGVRRTVGGVPVWGYGEYDVWNPAENVFLVSLRGVAKACRTTLIEAEAWLMAEGGLR